MEGLRDEEETRTTFSRPKGLTFCPAFINKFRFIYAARRYVIIINWPRDI